MSACLVNVGLTLIFTKLNSLEHTYHRYYSSVWSLVTKLNSHCEVPYLNVRSALRLVFFVFGFKDLKLFSLATCPSGPLWLVKCGLWLSILATLVQTLMKAVCTVSLILTWPNNETLEWKGLIESCCPSELEVLPCLVLQSLSVSVHILCICVFILSWVFCLSLRHFKGILTITTWTAGMQKSKHGMGFSIH